MPWALPRTEPIRWSSNVYVRPSRKVSKEGFPPVPRIANRNAKLLRAAGPCFLLISVVAAATLATATASQGLPSTSPQPQDSSPLPSNAQAAPRVVDSVSHEGPFPLDNQQFTVVLHNKLLLDNSHRPPTAANSTSTLLRLEILDNQANSVYQETFPYNLDQGHFTQTLSASASLLRGTGGTALVIRFLERPGPSTVTKSPPTPLAKESWQVFGLVNGRLAPFGPVLPLGHGTDITVSGTLAAVMITNGIEVMPMASTAEVLAFRVWTGNFYALVPVRFDWPHGKWGEGQECYSTNTGTLTERGCLMPLEAAPQPLPPDADPVYVNLFEAPDGNVRNSITVGIGPDSHPEFLDMMAIVQWQSQGQRVECTFRTLWLRIRINGHEGWVQGQQAFAALGLPLTSPR